MYGFKKYLGLQNYPEVVDEGSDSFKFEQSTDGQWKLHWGWHHRKKTCLCVEMMNCTLDKVSFSHLWSI